MKPLKVVILGALLSGAIVGASGGSVSWVSDWSYPGDPGGWYWMYDDAEAAPPFAEPALDPMPEGPYSEYSIHNNPDAIKIEPFDDEPYSYVLPDSFWYFGIWYDPGHTLYISPDGWISFDDAAQKGFPAPPDIEYVFPAVQDPNSLIAALWENFDPTRSSGAADNNRIYYMYDSISKTLWVEWYKVEHKETGNEYTFMTSLVLGGQERLEVKGACGVLFSWHLIHFYYNTASAGWEADGAETGFEDYTGCYGIHYKGAIDTQTDDFHAVRAGYKRVFNYDLSAIDIALEPDYPGHAGAEVEISATVMNLGIEPAGNSLVSCRIWDVSGSRREQIWDVNVQVDSIPSQIHNPDADYKREVTFPTFTSPQAGEMEIEVFAHYTRDECRANDTARLELTAIAEDENYVPPSFGLEVSSVIPASGECEIRFAVPHSSRVKLEVFGIDGRRITTLQSGTCRPGIHNLAWDGTDDSGRKISAGLYFIRMETDGFSDVRKLVIIN